SEEPFPKRAQHPLRRIPHKANNSKQGFLKEEIHEAHRYSDVGAFFCFVSTARPQAQTKPQIITFDVPGAGTGKGQGTNAIGVNALGSIVGWYIDQNNVSHGFLRYSNGSFATFDPPGSTSTITYALNWEGAIAGYYYDANNVIHGFLRYPNGDFTIFDAPGAGVAANQGTFPQFFSCLTTTGAITGFYLDANGVFHGFLRAHNGEITTFDPPGAGIGVAQGTLPFSINLGGAITGTYADTNTVLHGFLRAHNGEITTFDAPGAGTGVAQGTLGQANNPGGTIVGYYVDANNANHGFVRAPDGEIRTFDAPGAGAGANQGTYPETNNLEGAIAGYYIDANNVLHGFLRSR